MQVIKRDKLLNKLTAIEQRLLKIVQHWKGIDIPDTVTKIGTRTFSGCNSLAAVKAFRKRLKKQFPSYAFKRLQLLNGNKASGEFEFYRSKCVPRLRLAGGNHSASCAAVGSNAFAGCKGLVTGYAAARGSKNNRQLLL